MIIVNIKGGLGNQLFQYAFGKKLAVKFKKKLKLDISFFSRQDFRQFGLDKFNINFDGFINLKEKLLFKGAFYFPAYFDNFLCVKGDKNGFLLNSLDERNYYIDGYWQSENYFKEVSDILRDDYCLKDLSFVDKNLLNQISNNNSVSLHVRRGDYISIPINKNYNVCDLNYFYRAIEILKKNILNPHFFVFSDDMQWVKNNLKFDDACTFIDSGDQCLDFYLMSLCKNNIMANSTFSWWAAWLNKNPKKIVIAPKAWRTDEIREELFTDYQIRI